MIPTRSAAKAICWWGGSHNFSTKETSLELNMSTSTIDVLQIYRKAKCWGVRHPTIPHLATPLIRYTLRAHAEALRSFELARDYLTLQSKSHNNLYSGTDVGTDS